MLTCEKEWVKKQGKNIWRHFLFRQEVKSSNTKGSSINYVVQGERGSKIVNFTQEKDNKEGGGGQKSLILRQHSLWTAPITPYQNILNLFMNLLVRNVIEGEIKRDTVNIYRKVIGIVQVFYRSISKSFSLYRELLKLLWVIC